MSVQSIRHTPCAARRSRHALRAVALSFLTLYLTACGSYEQASAPPAQKPAATAQPAPATPQPQTQPAQTTPPTTPAAPAAATATPKSVLPTPPIQPAPNTVQTKADVGAGKQGHYGGVGIVVTPVSVYFRARERIAFQIQIPHAMDLFKASEGRPPKSHEEFMQRIIKENNVNLPPLPDDERYIYDVNKQELMIEQPRR